MSTGRFQVNSRDGSLLAKFQTLRSIRMKAELVRIKLSKISLGSRGKRALSRLLSPEELPLDTLSFYRSERVYRPISKLTARAGETPRDSKEIVAERSFAIPGINRFITIAVRPYRTNTEVLDSYDEFTVTVKKRWALIPGAEVSESPMILDGLPTARVVETTALYLGNDVRILSVANVVGNELLMVEFQCSAMSHWNASDCQNVIQLQIEKLIAIPAS